MHCPECEKIKRLVHKENRLLLTAPTIHTFGKLANIVRHRGLTVVPTADLTCLDIRLADSAMDGLVTEINGALSQEETEHCRALLMDAQREPTMSDFMATQSLRWVIASVKGRWLVSMLEQDRLFSLLQPIVNRDGSVFAYEALLRGREENGDLVSAGALLSVARETNLLFTVDLAARREAIRAMAKRRPQQRVRLFINFDPASIYDPAYCLRTTHSFVQEMGLNAPDIVFEVTEASQVTDLSHLRGILSFYRQAGFRVAMDDIGAGFSSLNLLQELRPDYVKIDMGLIRDVDSDPYKQSIVRHLIGIAADNSARVVAEGIETPAEQAWVLDAGIELLQGYLLGRPAAA